MRLLGTYDLILSTSPHLEGKLEEFKENSFKKHRPEEKIEAICSVLLEYIKESCDQEFILIPILSFIEKIVENKIVEKFHFSTFEAWFNRNYPFNHPEHHLLRGKIVGKYIPRIDYQHLFPIGIGQKYVSPHIVSAHPSPDLDTTVSSFWGWIDAFAAQVSDMIHLWYIPGGHPQGHTEIEYLFKTIFNRHIFNILAYEGKSLADEIKANYPHISSLNFTLRDYSNQDVTQTVSSSDVLSIIDHHKTFLTTTYPSVCYLSDTQSVNTVVAELSFKLTDRYSCGGMSLKSIEKQIEELTSKKWNNSESRILQRLLQKRQVVQQKDRYFVSRDREIIEVLHYFYAILDDTDLLSKVSPRDVECVAALLNRLKSLIESKEGEIIDFDDIERNEQFAKKAAARILQHPIAYELYSQIYSLKEKLIDQILEHTAHGQETSLFADTKEQNGCSRVGQIRLFKNNFPVFLKTSQALRKNWLKEAKKIYKTRDNFDFHLQLISTIPSAEQAYTSHQEYDHLDEIWFWIPDTEKGFERLCFFLKRFKQLSALKHKQIVIKYCAQDFSSSLVKAFTELFPEINIQIQDEGTACIIFCFPAGLLNSRKAVITPHLPLM